MKDAMDYRLIEEEDEQHFTNLQYSLDENPWLTEVLEREELMDALQNTCKVSDETRTQCEAELAAAKKRNWRLK
jgi:hypothetical protein